MKKTCPICKEQFTLKSPNQISCCDRCTYIRLKIAMPGAKSMSRDEAILNYGIMYDDPLRRLGKSKYRPLVRAIYDHCQEHNTKMFNYSVLPEKIKKDYAPRSLQGVATMRIPPIRQTKQKILNKNGTAKVFVWEFVMRIES